MVHEFTWFKNYQEGLGLKFHQKTALGSGPVLWTPSVIQEAIYIQDGIKNQDGTLQSKNQDGALQSKIQDGHYGTKGGHLHPWATEVASGRT